MKLVNFRNQCSVGSYWTYTLDDGTIIDVDDPAFNYLPFPMPLLIGSEFTNEHQAKQEFIDIMGFDFDQRIHSDEFFRYTENQHTAPPERAQHQTTHVASGPAAHGPQVIALPYEPNRSAMCGVLLGYQAIRFYYN